MSSRTVVEQVSFAGLEAQRRRLRARVDEAVRRVLDHGQFVMGPEVHDLEEGLARSCGSRHALTCSSGTDALLLALLALGVGAGDAVFVPAFTFAATAEVVALVGAVPVFADVRPDTFNLDTASLANAVASVGRGSSLRPRAVIAVDLFGQPADYEALAPVVADHELLLVADAAQSFGARWGDRKAGALAPVTATSFFPSKPLGCYGDGGAVFTDDDGLAAVVRSLRVHGQGSNKYDNVRVGINGRLDTIQAAVLLEKLVVFDEEFAARQRVAQRYEEALADIVDVPRLHPKATSPWAQYTIQVDRRDDVAAHLGGQGIPTAVYYPLPLHRQPAYRDCPTAPGGLSVSEGLARRVLSLPMHAYLDEAAQDRVVEALRAAVR